MQGAMDRAFQASATPLQKQYIPQGVNQLTEGILSKVGGHYGLSGPGFNTNLQQQKPAQGMSPQPPQGMGHGMPQLGGQMQHGMPGQAQSWQQVGGQGTPGLGGQMGAGSYSGMQGNLMGPLMQALQGQSNSGGNQLGGMPNLSYSQMGGNTMPTNRTMI